MKKRLLMMIAVVVCMGLGFSCEDQLTEITEEEILEFPNTDDDDTEEGKPGGQNLTGQNGG